MCVIVYFHIGLIALVVCYVSQLCNFGSFGSSCVSLGYHFVSLYINCPNINVGRSLSDHCALTWSNMICGYGQRRTPHPHQQF